MCACILKNVHNIIMTIVIISNTEKKGYLGLIYVSLAESEKFFVVKDGFRIF